MSHHPPSPPPPDEDLPLREFLKRYAASPPPASPDLEDRIMAAVLVPSMPPPQGVSLQTIRRRSVWVASLLAASFALLWTGSHLMSPPALTTAEMVELETFLESTWLQIEANAIQPDPDDSLTL